mgnify:CR=1 FL=1
MKDEERYFLLRGKTLMHTFCWYLIDRAMYKGDFELERIEITSNWSKFDKFDVKSSSSGGELLFFREKWLVGEPEEEKFDLISLNSWQWEFFIL